MWDTKQLFNNLVPGFKLLPCKWWQDTRPLDIVQDCPRLWNLFSNTNCSIVFGSAERFRMFCKIVIIFAIVQWMVNKTSTGIISFVQKFVIKLWSWDFVNSIHQVNTIKTFKNNVVGFFRQSAVWCHSAMWWLKMVKRASKSGTNVRDRNFMFKMSRQWIQWMRTSSKDNYSQNYGFQKCVGRIK